jgi:hypothetical protein
LSKVETRLRLPFWLIVFGLVHRSQCLSCRVNGGKMSEENKNNRKVIPFTGKYKKQPRLSLEDQKRGTMATVGFVLFLMIGFNFAMFETRFGQDEGRGIASVPTNYEPQWKESLSKMNKYTISKTAKKPTSIESLNFGPLAGQYGMRLANGRITQIHFLKNENGEPQTLGDRSQFIKDYSSAFVSGFMTVDKVRFEKDADGFKETYRVFSHTGESFFEFHFDDQKRFVSLSIK